MKWLHEPATWQEDEHTITVQAEPQTDFWRKTHNGEIHDNGHFFYQSVTDDFEAQVKVIGQYADQYDQAGLMIRVDEATWMKCGIEFVDNNQHVSAVVIRDWSDWSMHPVGNPPAIWLSVKRTEATLEVSYSLDGEEYFLIRQAFLTEAPTVQVGVMVAAPTGDGFSAIFEGFTVSSI